jgi:hypothetical protein
VTALLGAAVSAAITTLALPWSAATDTYLIIVGLGVLPYAAMGVTARFVPRPWLVVSIVLYAAVDVVLRAARLLGPDAWRNPLVVVTLPLLGAPLVLLCTAAVMALARRRRPQVSKESR